MRVWYLESPAAVEASVVYAGAVTRERGVRNGCGLRDPEEQETS